MEKTFSEITAAFTDHARSFQDLENEISRLERLIKEMAGRPCKPRSDAEDLSSCPSIELYSKAAGGDAFAASAHPAGKAQERPKPAKSAEGRASNIIAFPEQLFRPQSPGRREEAPARDALAAAGAGQSIYLYANKSAAPKKPFTAEPGKPLPGNLADYRPRLQRDGLILLAWDKRITEMGERYTAYWVTSAGTPRFYASKPLSAKDFPLARPDHKSYAAEDGIEFYGQSAPAFIVHTAPELMMSNPDHGKLREAHIESLKRFGGKTDFNYRYLLTVEKRKNPSLTPDNENHQDIA